jgi:beta-lactamase regulating signal transducer with metallopeptidase domain/membrane-associated protease RseP (regulator of RpoE activity)
MTGHWQALTEFLAHVLLAGGGVLLVGYFLGRMAAAPARRQCVNGWTVRAAVLAAGLCLLPSWITVPRWVGQAPSVTAAEPTSTEIGVVAEEAPSEEVVPDYPDPLAVNVEFGREPAGDESAITPVVETRSTSWREYQPYAVRAYLVVASALLVQLAFGHLALWRLRRSASPAPARVRDVFEELTSGDVLGTEVVVSDRLDAPVCFGVLKPAVVLPRRLAVEATADELRWVLAHELDHLRRGDPATAVWAGVARGLFFVWPWYWSVRRDLTLSQEYLADAAAAAAGGRPADYAAFLVNLSDPAVPRRHPGGSMTLLAAHAVRARRSDLFRRVNMVLSSDVNRRVSRGWAVVAGCGVMSAAVGFSGLGWAAADDDKPQPEVGKKIVLRLDDAPPSKPPAPPRRDGDRRETFELRLGDRPQGEEVGKIKRQIEEAMKDGRTEEAMKLVNQLERALSPRRVEVREIRPVGPVAPVPPAPPKPAQGQWRFDMKDGAMNAQAREAMEKALKALEQQSEKLGDKKEAQEALRAAADKMRADMEKSGTLQLQGQLFPQGGGFGGAAAGWNFAVRPMAGKLGIAVARVPDAVYEQVELAKGTGLLAVEVAGGSAADKAGVRKNDIIVRFAGKDVPNDERRFIEEVGAAKPGVEIEVIVLRKGKKESLTAKLPEPPKPAELRRIESGERRDRGAKATFEKRSVMITDDKFDIKATKDDVTYKLTGRVEEGRAVAEKIVVTDDDTAKEYKSLKDVPEQYQPAVRQLLGAVSGR